jgi:hypothetical protein
VAFSFHARKKKPEKESYDDEGFVGSHRIPHGHSVSFIIQTSDYDPTVFSIAMASIFIAIVGISLILEKPEPDAKTKLDSP